MVGKDAPRQAEAERASLRMTNPLTEWWRCYPTGCDTQEEGAALHSMSHQLEGLA